jgi:hypothetical protein
MFFFFRCPRSQPPTRKMSCKERKEWSYKEKKAVKRQLSSFISSLKTPGKRACDDALRKKPVLSSRILLDIKNCVHNLNQAKKREMRPLRILVTVIALVGRDRT